MSFLKKFFLFAKASYEPKLTEESALLIGTEYATLRTEQANKMNGYPITARCLETLIMLSTAHAKLRLSDTVESVDVESALRVLKHAIDGKKYEKGEEKMRKKMERERKQREDRDDDSDNDDDDDGTGRQPSTPEEKKRNLRGNKQQKKKIMMMIEKRRSMQMIVLHVVVLVQILLICLMMMLVTMMLMMMMTVLVNVVVSLIQ